MQGLISLILKFTGANWVWNKTDGYKTKLSSIALMLSGGTMMLAGAAQIILAAVACTDAACVLNIVEKISDNPNAKNIAEGFVIFSAGMSALGIGHKFEKAASTNAPAQTPAPVEEPKQ